VKASGEVLLDSPCPDDVDGFLFAHAAAKLRQH
jgi:hypothetical protein